MILKLPLAWLIQNGFTGEAKAGEARKTGFFRLLVHFNPGLQNGFTLPCLDLRKIDEAEADISCAKEALNMIDHSDRDQMENTVEDGLADLWVSLQNYL